MAEILIIDDEADIRDFVSDILKDEGFFPKVAANCQQAFNIIDEKVPSGIILDIWLQGSELDGLGILEQIKKRYPLMPVVVISGHGNIETAVSAIKLGAYDYLEKPFTQNRLMIVLKRALENAKLKKENNDLKSKVIDKSEMIGNSTAMIRLKSEIEKIAPTSGRVMITGETGTGKELAARLIHKKSKRSSGNFVTFCPTGLTTERILNELFNESDKIEPTNVSQKRLSILEAANNGTLYLDEISDLPLVVQNRLLRFLQDQILDKQGSKSLRLDIRIISSSTKNLQQEVLGGSFRQDLFYRLNVVPLRVPQLSERKDDIPLLAQYFIKQLSKFSGLKERVLSDEAIAALQAYNWPGNIRQLKNVIEWTLIMNPYNSSENPIIKPEMLPSDILTNGITILKSDTPIDLMSMSLRDAREVFERQYLAAQMNRFNNNISKTSAFVGMERSALHRKLKLLNIHSNYKFKDEIDLIDDEIYSH
jgi:two-component system nitrogen regulation response regulator NtrX